jgi:hypothetical protein
MAVVGAAVVVLLVAALLAREAWSLGAVTLGARRRRALDTAIIALTTAFVTVLVVQLVTL